MWIEWIVLREKYPAGPSAGGFVEMQIWILGSLLFTLTSVNSWRY